MQVTDKLDIKVRDMGDGRYEVEGVTFYTDNAQDAVRKWLRRKR